MMIKCVHITNVKTNSDFDLSKNGLYTQMAMLMRNLRGTHEIERGYWQIDIDKS